jgi:hypothetical protein
VGLVSLTPRLVGRFAAVDQGRYTGRKIVSRRVRVVDLSSGRLVHSYSEKGEVGVTDMELKSSGSVAWISHILGRGFTVHKIERRHELLYQGSLVPGSLALSGSSLYWLTPDGPRTARLD